MSPSVKIYPSRKVIAIGQREIPFEEAEYEALEPEVRAQIAQIERNHASPAPNPRTR